MPCLAVSVTLPDNTGHERVGRMAIVSDFTADWSASVTLAADEFWQCQKGPIYIATAATSAPAALDDGMLLSEGDILALTTGDVVRYRSARPDGTGRAVRRAKA